MNCLEFRRRLGSEPASIEPRFNAHRESCLHCSAAQARAFEFEGRLQRAVLVPVPTGLADRILLAQTTTARREQRVRHRHVAALFAAAACVIVAFTYVHRSEQLAMPLSELVVEHVLHHERHAVEQRDPVPKSLVEVAFARRGAALANVPDGISYVHECPVGPYSTVHMVMPESSGPVSVVYVADPAQRERRDFESGGMRGREVPLGSGALIMLAADDRGFDDIERAWKGALGNGVAQSAVFLREATPAASPIRAEWSAPTAAP